MGAVARARAPGRLVAGAQGVAAGLAAAWRAAQNRYTMQWASMFILLFFTEGIVRATSDVGLSRSLAWGEVALSVVFFAATIFYLRPFKRAAKARASQST